MNVLLRIPDDIAASLTEQGADLEREALEAFAVEAYRADRLSEAEVGRLLGFETRHEVDGFLKARGVYYDMTIEDVRRDIDTLKRLGF